VVIASGADLQGINPLFTVHPLAKQVQRYVLLTTLVRYDSTLAVKPYLGRSWAWSADAQTLTFRLVRNVRWHDGARTTARDVAWTLEAARDRRVGYPRFNSLADLDSTRAVDDSTVSLFYRRRQARVPDVLTDLAILPAHLFKGLPRARLREAAWNQVPVGNGPFKFVTHEPNRRWVFARNDAFPKSLGGPPKLERLVIAVVDEPTTKLAALTSGELDMAGIQPAHAEFVRKDPRLTVIDYPGLFSYVVVFNSRKPPFNNSAVRRAIAMAIDRPEIVSGVLFGFGIPARHPLPPPLVPDSGAPPYYAPGRGRAMLGSRSLDFELLTVGSGEGALEQLIQAQLARIGVTVRIRQLELSAFLDRVNPTAHDFEAAVLGVAGDLAASHLGPLAELAGLRSVDDGERLLTLFRDSMPATFLYHSRGVQGMNRRVLGVRMDLRGELPTVTRWRTTP
jgi:peptide/nickel transport system substrate-binding protein